ncbi:hypothetical protein [Halalkalibacter lacteus]|uniref:hypothetical protein n=1 Tax=Halalkalibacter lacteus TaxID=3090663 RepID=UPI002FC6BB6C
MNIILLITSIAYLFLYTSHFQAYQASGLDYELVSVFKELQISETTNPKEPNAQLVQTTFVITFLLLIYSIQ